MLKLTAAKPEEWDERLNQFIPAESVDIELEHSLFSLSKWEEKWETPFLGNESKTDEQAIDYIRCMTLTPDVPAKVYTWLNGEQLNEINTYINAKKTATWFGTTPKKPGSSEIITSEVIYYWLVTGQIDFQVQYWHLNRLMTLIKVIGEKQDTGKAKGKMSPAQLAARNRELNAKRRADMQSTG